MRLALSRLTYSALMGACLFGIQAHAQTWPANSPYEPWLLHYASGQPDAYETTRGSSAELVAAPYAMPEEEPRKKSQRSSTQHRNDGPVLTPQDTHRILMRLEEQERQREASLLEQAYSLRVIDELSQFGYEMFATANTQDFNTLLSPDHDKRKGLPGGMAQDDFILSSGDRLSITLRGQTNSKKSYEIDDQGFLLIDDMAPIAAAGLTLAQVRRALEAEIGQRHNMQIFATLEAVHQIDILILGHVKKPGRQTLSVFNSVLDALNEAGGIDKSGSLRQIKLVRDGRSTYIDLYGLLIHGSTNMDLQLRDGDRLIVPPIGPTVAIAGAVKRPGIYEIMPRVRGMHSKTDNSEKLSLEEALAMAGGYLTPGSNRLLRLSLGKNGQENVKEVSGNPYTPLFDDGSILMVSQAQRQRTGTVELLGAARQPGIYALEDHKTLAGVIPSPQSLSGDIYPLMGVIERQSKDNLSVEMIDFSPLLVAHGEYDAPLQDGDTVHLFSRAQIGSLDLDNSKPRLIEAGSNEADMLDDSLRYFMKEHAVQIRGAVREPGLWPIAEESPLSSIIQAAGGLTIEASKENIEISALNLHDPQKEPIRQSFNLNKADPETILINPGDAIRINQKYNRITDNSVLLTGEVKHPGRYDLAAGDSLLDLLERAGGLTAQAYPDGAIFSRESERRAEESRFRAAARELERALAVSMDKETPPDATQIAMAQDLATELKNVEAVGRITVEADPGMLKQEPELNILLEKGDRTYIPKRPLTVRVNGEVLSPANLQFRKNKDARDYIVEAGGYTYNADDDRAFVLYPDGSAQPLQVSNWNHKATFIPPGSTIVVPRDPKPFDFIQSAKDISQILSNLAVTGIFLDDIRDDD